MPYLLTLPGCDWVHEGTVLAGQRCAQPVAKELRGAQNEPFGRYCDSHAQRALDRLNAASTHTPAP